MSTSSRNLSTSSACSTSGVEDIDAGVCEACDNGTAVEYCKDCPSTLCSSCVVAHRRLRPTRDHVLCKLNEADSHLDDKANEAGKDLHKPTCHDDDTADMYCDDCKCSLCEKCKSKHRGHTVLRVETNPKAYQAVYEDHLQKLLDGFHELTEYKDALDNVYYSYEQAVQQITQWEVDLLKRIQEKAHELRTELKKSSEEWKHRLRGLQGDVEKALQDIDGELSKFEDLITTNNWEKLQNEMEGSLKMMKAFKEFQSALPELHLPTTADILPNAAHFTSIEEGIDNVLTMSPNCKCPTTTIKNASSFPIDDVTLKYTTDIPNPNSVDGYKICKCEILDTIVLHGRDTSDVRLYNPKTREMEQHTSEVCIWNMVAASRNEYITIWPWGFKNSIYIIDRNFVTQCRIKTPNSIRALCYLSSQRFIAFGMKSKPSRAVLSTMIIKGKSLEIENTVTVDIQDDPWFIASCGNKSIVSLLSNKNLHKVDLQQSSCSSHDVTQFIKSSITSFCLDSSDNVIIGDDDGNIHWIDVLFNHKIVFKIQNGFARDLNILDKTLLVTTSNNQVLVYE